MRQLWIFVVIVLVAGCATRVSSIRTDEVVPLVGGSGYLLIGVETAHDLNFVDLDGPKSIRLSDKDLRAGTNYILIELPAGVYTISELTLGTSQRFVLDDEDNWQVDVKKQRISYVGHLVVKSRGYWARRASIELENRSSQALEFLEQDFPVILAGYPLDYGGPGKDHFLPYVASQNGSAD
ncbi:hypothetical protein [Pseudidiomarina sp.]|uniref:hypothetical protein n=1 Tax=Pseudidiomarina sp. TaxID=2081707 RepID=UPI00299D3B92|nr:hypothetical protein [Pseudidiomarina sp.]MDX1704846.1 hypothetical protein [Pseudidiomarina sp.]